MTESQSAMTMTNLKTSATLTLGAALMALPGAAYAQDETVQPGRPSEGAIGMQPASTPLADEVHQFHNVVLLPVISVICLFVLGLLIWVILRYNKRANPVPKKFSHNTLVEVLWTAIPIMILLYIALFSFDLLYKEDVIPDGIKTTYVSDGTQTDYLFENDFQPSRMVTRDNHLEVYIRQDGELLELAGGDYELDGLGEPQIQVSLNNPAPAGTEIQIVGGRSRTGVEPFLGLFGEDTARIATRPSVTIKATGYQWGWNYSYPDYGDFELDALNAPRESLDDPSLYRLAATNNVVVPEGETIRIITTARDVIHSWAMPAFALKIDAVPGRHNETWFRAPEAGMYYGQCSEICGKDHAFMPIALEVLPRDDYEAWIDEQRALAGMEPMFENETRLADAASSETDAPAAE